MDPSDSSSDPFPTAAQLVDRVPLIKNPGFWVPKPVQLPPDIHPLPDDVQAYFVYPHSLEAHVLDTLPRALADLNAAHQQRLALLASHAESKERARRAELNRLAPGWHEGEGVMQPRPRRRTVPPSDENEHANPDAADQHHHHHHRGRRRGGEHSDLLLDDDDDDDDNNSSGGGGAGGPTPSEGTSGRLRTGRGRDPAPPAADPFKDFVDGLEKLDSTLGAAPNRAPGAVDDLI